MRLCSKLVFGRTELASCGGRLFEMLLFLSVGIPNLNRIIFAVSLNRLVVEGFDDFLAGLAILEAKCVNTCDRII